MNTSLHFPMTSSLLQVLIGIGGEKKIDMELDESETEEERRVVPFSRREGHPVWRYFERLDRFDAVCLMCTRMVRSACSTNLCRHMVRHHPESAAAIATCWEGRGGRESLRNQETQTSAVDPAASPEAAASLVASSVRRRLESVESVECAEKMRGGVSAAVAGPLLGMNHGDSDAAPACPVALHPYGIPAGMSSGPLMAPMGAMGSMGPMTSMGTELAGLGLAPAALGLSSMDLSHSWCLPTAASTYTDIRTVEHTGYEHDINALSYAQTGQKFDNIKYEYGAKEYEPRLYHKEQEEVCKDVPDEPEAMAGDSKEEGKEATPARRGRPTENPCWNYFLRIDDQNVRCRLCSKVVKSACATNMTKHLERHHQQDYQHLIVQIKQYRSQKGPGTSTSPPMSVGCILQGNPYVKTEPYSDVYSTQQFDRDDVLRSFYERPEVSAWSPWCSWTANTEPGTSEMPRQGGVILHASMANSNNWNPVAPTSSAFIEKPYMKRNRKTEHPVWEYFKRTADGHAQCALCACVVKSPCSSNFMRHLMRHHSPEYNTVYLKWVQKRTPSK